MKRTYDFDTDSLTISIPFNPNPGPSEIVKIMSRINSWIYSTSATNRRIEEEGAFPSGHMRKNKRIGWK